MACYCSSKIVAELAKKFPKQLENIKHETKNANAFQRIPETDRKAFNISNISMRNTIFRQAGAPVRAGPFVDTNANEALTLMMPKKTNVEYAADIAKRAKEGDYNYGLRLDEQGNVAQEPYVGSFIELRPIENFPLFLQNVEYLFTHANELKDIDIFLSREIFEMTKHASFKRICGWLQHRILHSIKYYVLFCFNKQGYPPYMFITSPTYLSDGQNICLGNSVYHANNFAAASTLEYIASTALVISSFATEISGALHLSVHGVHTRETQIKLLKSYLATTLLNEIELGGLMERTCIEQLSTIAINELQSSQTKMKEAKIDEDQVLKSNITRVAEAEKRRNMRQIFAILQEKRSDVMISMTKIASNVKPHISLSAADIFEKYIMEDDLLACFICILRLCEILPHELDVDAEVESTVRNIAAYQDVIGGNLRAVDNCPEAIKLAQIIADEGDVRAAAATMQQEICMDKNLIKRMNLAAFNKFIAPILLAGFDDKLRTLFELVL